MRTFDQLAAAIYPTAPPAAPVRSAPVAQPEAEQGTPAAAEAPRRGAAPPRTLTASIFDVFPEAGRLIDQQVQEALQENEQASREISQASWTDEERRRWATGIGRQYAGAGR